MRSFPILISVALAALPARAADASAQLVAGYKALFTCSATFVAKRTPEQIAEFELTGIYRDYEAAMAKLPVAQVDVAAGSVSVRRARRGNGRVRRAWLSSRASSGT